MRLIDADALKANCDIMVGNTTIGRRDYVMFHEIDSAPSIDIVRCCECKWADKCSQNVAMQDTYQMYEKIGFCSYGERRE